MNPKKTISIIDTDLEVDFEAPWDYVEPKPKPIEKPPSLENNSPPDFKLGSLNFNRNYKKDDKDKDKDNDKGGFVPFSGVGRRLGSK